MFEWNMSVQKMLDCVEENLTEPLTLEMLAGLLNYSPFYCTRQFHKYAGISLRNYIRLRKVSSAVIDLRDTGERIIDIAVKYGFSSQEAFTRSFKRAYGMTPNEYRRMPEPLPLLVKRNVFNPYYLGLMEKNMKEDLSKNVRVSIQVIPAQKMRRSTAATAVMKWTASFPALRALTASSAPGFIRMAGAVICTASKSRRAMPARYRRAWTAWILKVLMPCSTTHLMTSPLRKWRSMKPWESSSPAGTRANTVMPGSTTLPVTSATTPIITVRPGSGP